MKYTILLWPHANARYRNETQKLAEAELSVLLRCVASDAQLEAIEQLGMPALDVKCEKPLSEEAVRALQGHSLMYGLFECREDGSLMPIAGRETAYLGEDLPGILKYKGKTNELFTQLLMNVALYSGNYWNTQMQVRLLDPMCGRGTTLFIGANRRWDCTGSDVDKNDVKEAEKFFKRYLEYHRFKHALEHQSLTVRGKKPASCAAFTFSDTAEHYKEKSMGALKLVNSDAGSVSGAFGKRTFHLIVCDLPYGVQHDAFGGSLEKLLAEVLPVWRDALLPGGTIAVSFNAQTLRTQNVWELMEKAGMEPLCEGPYRQFSHWVEQAVTRDIAVCRKKH